MVDFLGYFIAGWFIATNIANISTGEFLGFFLVLWWIIIEALFLFIKKDYAFYLKSFLSKNEFYFYAFFDGIKSTNLEEKDNKFHKNLEMKAWPAITTRKIIFIMMFWVIILCISFIYLPKMLLFLWFLIPPHLYLCIKFYQTNKKFKDVSFTKEEVMEWEPGQIVPFLNVEAGQVEFMMLMEEKNQNLFVFSPLSDMEQKAVKAAVWS